ncbi:MAG TPA: PKD domain-containing protein, partial [Polyangiaceae bacterium]|nr:PKD domain-containing protein [Polyangiaceae bacterium]
MPFHSPMPVHGRRRFLITFGILVPLASGCGDDHEGPLGPGLDAGQDAAPPGGDGSGAQGDSAISSDGGLSGEGGLHDGGGQLDGAAIHPDGGLDAGLGNDGGSSGPLSAGFQLSELAGTTPFWVQAVSSASGGRGGALAIRYDWGEGAGFEPRASHRYLHGGTYTVTQEVRDGDGLSAQASATISVTDFAPVRFSTSDHSAIVFISPDAYELELRGWGAGGARSDSAIAPQSGVFYFEGRRLIQPAIGDFGVATATATLGEAPGASAQSMGALGWGPIQSAGGTCTGDAMRDSEPADIGFVIDYRAATPLIHVIQQGDSGMAAVRGSCTMAVSAPLYVYYSAERGIVGDQARINTGADTTNFP